MRKIIFLLVIILAVPNILWAADPIIGIWKLNLEKSTSNPPGIILRLKEETNIYREIDGGMIELSGTQIFTDGSTNSFEYKFPKEGGINEGPSEVSPEDTLRFAVLVEPGHWYSPTIKNGKQSLLYHKRVSKDGKTLTQTLKGIGRNGNFIDIIKVFEKQ